MKYLAILFLIAACFFASGCASNVAKPYVKPYLAALEVYHKSHKQYPKTLDELQSANQGLLEGFHASNAGINGIVYTKVKGRYVDWTLTYRLDISNSYFLMFQRGDVFVGYKNGKVISAERRWWM